MTQMTQIETAMRLAPVDEPLIAVSIWVIRVICVKVLA
jgi:hypothetical protein